MSASCLFEACLDVQVQLMIQPAFTHQFAATIAEQLMIMHIAD
jgi:hypothetical protein